MPYPRFVESGVVPARNLRPSRVTEDMTLNHIEKNFVTDTSSLSWQSAVPNMVVAWGSIDGSLNEPFRGCINFVDFAYVMSDVLIFMRRSSQ